ncbi:MAG: aspartyl protease family protein [Candidatus Zixiibacteriota bacterium]|jgi:hypothetical protein
MNNVRAALAFAALFVMTGAGARAQEGPTPVPMRIEMEAPEVDMDGDAAEVPFRLVGNLILVDVAAGAGEQPQPFILDTGTTMTLVDASAVDVPPGNKVGVAKMVGPGGESEIALVKLDRIAVGGARLVGATAASGDLAAIRRMTGLEIAGLLGQDFLRNFVVEIDYDASTVTFHDPAAFEDPAEVEFVPARMGGGPPVVEMTVGGHTGGFVVDLGNRSAVVFDEGYVAEHDMINEAEPKLPAVLMGAGGAAPKPLAAHLARMDGLTIGSYEVRGPVVVLPELSDSPMTCGLGLTGNVGFGVMSRFTLCLDYPGGRLGLAPGESFDAPFDYDRSGILLRPAAGHYVVEKVVPASPAEKLFAVGDKVTAVNGRPAAEVAAPEWARLRSGPAGTVLELTVERGDGSVEDVSLRLTELL